VPSVAHLAPTHLGLDVHKDTISVAILAPDRDGPDVERITHDEASVRRLVGRFPEPRRLRACSEAGPTGYELARLLHSMGVRCEVIAPSLIPKAPGDKVKTDRRDCGRLARLHRAGELVAIRIPTIQEEAVRDLCRARADMVADRTRARHRLSRVPAAPRPGLAGRERLDPDPRALAASATLRGARPGRDLCPGPGGAGCPRRPAGGDPGRPGRLV
jgi:transposase